jgi:hypothetical protein
MENQSSGDGGPEDQISNTNPGGHKLHVASVPSPDRSALRVRRRFPSNSERRRRIPRQLRDGADRSQSGDLARPFQRFFQRHPFNLASFDFSNAAVRFRLPCIRYGGLQPAMPRNKNTIHQFRHHLTGHFPGFLNDLIQCHRHGPNLAHPGCFDNLEAETEEKTSETVIQKIFDELPVP